MQYPPFGFFWWHCSSCSKVDALVLKRPQDKTSFGCLTVMRPWTMEVPYFCQKRSIVRVQILKWSEGQRIDLRKKGYAIINILPKRYRNLSENPSKIAQNLTKNRPKIAPKDHGSSLLLPKEEYCPGPDIEVIRRSEDWSKKKRLCSYQ